MLPHLVELVLEHARLEEVHHGRDDAHQDGSVPVAVASEDVHEDGELEDEPEVSGPQSEEVAVVLRFVWVLCWLRLVCILVLVLVLVLGLRRRVGGWLRGGGLGSVSGADGTVQGKCTVGSLLIDSS
jgi:hypothetical protein